MVRTIHEPRLYGHRGASARKPENTLPAFERALADGAHALELDVHRTADGHFVVAHDPDGRRMAGEREAIREIGLDRIKRWNVRGAGGEGRFEVPTLDEVLAAFPGVPMSIDVKPDIPDAMSGLLELLAAHNASATTTLASFNIRVVNRVRALGYEGRTALTRLEVALLRFLPSAFARRHIAGQAAQVPTRSGAIRLDTPRFLAACRTLGLRADYWVVNDPTRARALLDAGATGIMSDDPAAIAPVFASRL